MPDDTGLVDDAPDAGVTYYEVQSIITCLKCESTENRSLAGFFPAVNLTRALVMTFPVR